jgi:hypothetical protein
MPSLSDAQPRDPATPTAMGYEDPLETTGTLRVRSGQAKPVVTWYLFTESQDRRTDGPGRDDLGGTERTLKK